MNLQYVENISNDNKEATMRLYGRIGGDINGAAFADEMRYLSNIYSSIKMRINSEGGSVLEGYTILDAMNEIKASGNCVIKTHNSGMAASMASVVLCNGEAGFRTADNYAVTMIHNAGGDTSDSVLKAINESIQIIYKDRTRLNGDTASDLMNKETFMNCDMAMEYGFIDEVVQTGKKVKLPAKKSVEALAKIYNELLKPKQMTKVTNLLGINNEASEDVIAENISKLQKELKDATDAKEAAEAKLKEFEDAENKRKEAEAEKAKSNATELVQNAFKNKLIEESQVEGLTNLAVADFKTVSNMISSLESASKKAKTAVNVHTPSDKGEKPADDRTNWTIVDWQKKDPKGLTEIQNTTPEVYAQMYDNFYKLGINNPKFKHK